MNATTRWLALTGWAVIVWISISLAVARASSASTPAAATDACRTETNDVRRLECYDRVFGKPGAVAGQSAKLPASASPLSTSPRSTSTAPAPPDSQPPAQDRAPLAAAPLTSAAPVRLFSAKITALRFRERGAFIATLDNGQQWEQYVAEGKARVSVGDTVSIRPGWLGSYILKGPSDWITKVHPLQNPAPAN